MVEPRTVEDRIRAEYFDLLPAMRRAFTAIETEVRHILLPATLALHPHEHIVVRSRLKDCESALNKLRREEGFGVFDPDEPGKYSLTSLPDLVGVRVLTFPERRLESVRQALWPRISEWEADHVTGAHPEEGPIAFKYRGFWKPDDPVKCEIQVVSLLIGLFWEVEHSAIYKPSPNLRGVAESGNMRQRTAAVETALKEFEREFGRLIEDEI